MYKKQKQDNLDFWQMQNEYNAPIQQIQRYKDAGLNPALMYGGATAGNASQIQAPSKPEYHHQRADMSGIGGGIQAGLEQFYATKQMQIQMANAEKTGRLIDAQTARQLRETDFIDSRESNVQANTNRTNSLTPFDMILKNQNIEKIRKEIELSQNRDERQAQLQGYTIQQMVLNQENTRLRNEYLKTTTTGQNLRNAVTEAEAQLARIGVFKGDPLYYRVASQLSKTLAKTMVFTKFGTETVGDITGIVGKTISNVLKTKPQVTKQTIVTTNSRGKTGTRTSYQEKGR